MITAGIVGIGALLLGGAALGSGEWWTRRAVSVVMHCIVPGTGFIVDAYDATEQIKQAVEAGEMSSDQAKAVLEDLKSAAENGKELVLDGKKLQVRR